VQSLGFQDVRIIDAGKNAYKIGVCAGSGMDLWHDALDLGCDTFVTGDVTYHKALDAFEAGLNVVDLGHAATEEVVIKPFADMLSRKLQKIKVMTMAGRPLFRSVKTKVTKIN
jgi:putative NIF3 family GTP cyclohydrolase 1 type 2